MSQPLIRLTLFLSLSLSGVSSLWANNTLNLGFLAYRPKEVLEPKWSPLAEYLSDSINGHEVKLHILTEEEIYTALQKGELDLILTNSAHYIRLRQGFKLSGALATIMRSQNEQVVSSLGGVVFTRKDRQDINRYVDIIGQRIATMGNQHLGSYIAPIESLMREGVDVDELDLTYTGQPQDQVITKVLKGEADVGFVRTGTLEQLVSEGRLEMENIKVLHSIRQRNFPFRLSTGLYPEWPFFALPHVDSEISRKVAAALLSLPQNHPAAESAGIFGFDVPADYTPVENAKRLLRLPPFNQPPLFTLKDVWQEHHATIIPIGIATLLIFILAISQYVMIRRLIHARKEIHASSQRLKRERDKAQRILDTVETIIVRLDGKGNIQALNRKGCELLGHPEEILLGQNWFKVALKQPQGMEIEYPRYLRALLDEEVQESTGKQSLLGYEGEIHQITWSRRWLHNENGKVVGTLCAGTDISGEHRALQELQCFKRTLDLTMDGVLMFDAESLAINYANQGVVSQLGYTHEQLLKLTPIDLNIDWKLDRLLTILDPLIEGSERSLVQETYFIRRNGKEFPVEVFLQYFDPDDDKAHFLAIVRDISSRKEQERALQAAAHEADRANQAKSVFLANMSHEIRTPMNAILGLTQLLQEHELDEEASNKVQYIYSSANSLMGILNDILDYSKVESGQLKITYESFRPMEMITEIKELYQASMQRKGLEFKVGCSPVVPDLLVGDSLRIRQILNNLIGNALKFTEKGGVELFLDFSHREESHLWLKGMVTDTGIGFDLNMIDNLFKPFTQADATITRKYGGSGLGLSIIKYLVDMMHGKIHVESSVGKGTRFEFTLRLGIASGEREGRLDLVEPIINRAPILAGLRVLLVEDQRINQIVAAELLQSLQMEVSVASDGYEAVELVKKYTFDLVLMDLHMPGMDGFKTSKEILKIHQDGKSTPAVIAMSAAVLESDRTMASDAGMIDFIPKPIDVGCLVEIITQHMPQKSNE